MDFAQEGLSKAHLELIQCVEHCLTLEQFDLDCRRFYKFLVSIKAEILLETIYSPEKLCNFRSMCTKIMGGFCSVVHDACLRSPDAASEYLGDFKIAIDSCRDKSRAAFCYGVVDGHENDSYVNRIRFSIAMSERNVQRILLRVVEVIDEALAALDEMNCLESVAEEVERAQKHLLFTVAELQ